MRRAGATSAGAQPPASGDRLRRPLSGALGSMPHAQLSPETQRRLDALFVGPARQTAADLLITQCGNNLPFCEGSDARALERVRFAALKLSNGDLVELQRAVQIAQLDSRDVLVAAAFANDVRAHESWFPEGHAA